MAIKFNQVILNKLFQNKTELSEKVDLNIISRADEVITDLEKIEEIKLDSMSEVNNAAKVLEDLYGELITAKRDLNVVIERERFISPSEDFINNAKQVLNEINESANELGVSPDNIPEYEKLDNAIYLAEYDLEQVKNAIDLAKDTLERYL